MRRTVRRLTLATTDIPRRVWDEVLVKLSKHEVEAVRLRFGLDVKSPRNVEEIARTLRLSREHVRRIETKARRRPHRTSLQHAP